MLWRKISKIVKYTRGIPRKIQSRPRGITAKIIPVTVVTAGFVLISVSTPAGFPRGCTRYRTRANLYKYRTYGTAALDEQKIVSNYTKSAIFRATDTQAPIVLNGPLSDRH